MSDASDASDAADATDLDDSGDAGGCAALGGDAGVTAIQVNADVPVVTSGGASVNAPLSATLTFQRDYRVGAFTQLSLVEGGGSPCIVTAMNGIVDSAGVAMFRSTLDPAYGGVDIMATFDGSTFTFDLSRSVVLPDGGTASGSAHGAICGTVPVAAGQMEAIPSVVAPAAFVLVHATTPVGGPVPFHTTPSGMILASHWCGTFGTVDDGYNAMGAVYPMNSWARGTTVRVYSTVGRDLAGQPLGDGAFTVLDATAVATDPTFDTAPPPDAMVATVAIGSSTGAVSLSGYLWDALVRLPPPAAAATYRLSYRAGGSCTGDQLSAALTDAAGASTMVPLSCDTGTTPRTVDIAVGASAELYLSIMRRQKAPGPFAPAEDPPVVFLDDIHAL